MSRYCPEWLFGAVSALVGNRFISSSLPIEPFAVKYSQILSEKYVPIPDTMLLSAAEGFLRAIIEANSEDADVILHSFAYNRLMILPSGESRKFKGLFSSALDGSKECEYSAEQAVKSFKPFVYMIRAKPALAAPAGWTWDDIEDGDWLRGIQDIEVSILDSL